MRAARRTIWRKLGLTATLGLIAFMSSIHSYAGVEPVLRNLLQDTSLRVDSILTVEDIQYNLNQLGNYHLVKAKNRVSLSLNQDNLIYCMNDSFSCGVSAEIKSWDKDGNLSTDTVDLEINYSIEKGHKYQERTTYTFEGAYKVEAKILSVCDTFLAPYLVFSAEVELERYQDLVASISPSFYNHNLNSDQEIELSWNEQLGAEEYELEWLIIDDYDGDNGFINPTQLEYDFRNNSARVVLTSTSYKVSAVHEHGYLLFRVRAVGLTGSKFTHRVNGKWSSDGFANTVSAFNLSQNAFFVDTEEHEPNLNWQYVSSFAEEGKKKEIVSYYDGSLRNRQSVTRVNSDENTIVSENHYDHQGRMAIQVLPVPSFNNILKYYTNFSRFEDGKLYDKSRFDTGKCAVPTQPMNDSSGASMYYSSSNLDLNGPNAHLASYIPDAEGFPFSRTLYMNDNTGRIKAQGGVGLTHQLGSGHETKYFYGTPFQEELDRLFGNSVGYKDHYQKNMVIDPNGQVSVSYLDLSGRVIATSLAGETPDNVQRLENQTDSIDLEVDLLSNSDSLLSKKGLEFSKTINVAFNSWHYFDYSVDPAAYQDSCMDSSFCMDCIYDLEISLKDDCGQELLDGNKNMAGIQTLKRVIGTPLEFMNTQCDSGLNYNFGNDSLLEEEVKAYLGVGTYTLTKTLTVNQEALDYYTDEFVKNTTCVKTLADFENQFMAEIDYSGCTVSCDSCLIQLGAEADFVTRILSELATEGLTTTQEDSLRAIAMYNEQALRCDYLCKDESPCEVYRTILEADIAEGGQYYEEISIISEHPEYCVYQACLDNESCKLYDQKMQKVGTLKEAIAAGYMDPLNYNNQYPDGDGDVCVMNDAALDNALRNKLDNYTSIGGTSISLWETVILTYNCWDENASDAELQNCIAAYTLDTNSCGLQGDLMWNLFKAAYIAEKNKLLESPACSPTIATGKERRLYTMANVEDMPEGNNPTDQKNNNQDSLDDSYEDNCKSYADFWMQKLVNCNLSIVDSIAVRNALINVCIDGSDNTHPMGSSSVSPVNEPGVVYKNFKEVLEGMGVYVPGVCDDLLIAFPAPYDSKLNQTLTVDSNCTDNSCLAGLNQKLKETLRMSQFPAECEKCIDCSKLKEGIENLNAHYGYSLFLDAENKNWTAVIENYLNREFGMTMLYQDYIEMAKTCTQYNGGDSSLLDSMRNSYFIQGESYVLDNNEVAYREHSVINTYDGNIMVLSEVTDVMSSQTKFNLSKMTNGGTLLWSKDYSTGFISQGLGKYDDFMDLKQTKDSGYVFVANPTWNFKSTYSTVVIKVNPVGDIDWQKELRGGPYQNDRSSYLRSILISDSGDIIVSGDVQVDSCLFFSQTFHDVSPYYVKLAESTGNILFSSLALGASVDYLTGVNDMYELTSGNRIEVGTLHYFGAGTGVNSSSYAKKRDALGTITATLAINSTKVSSLTVSNNGEDELVCIGSFADGNSRGIQISKFDSSLNNVWTEEYGVPGVTLYTLTPNKIIKNDSGYAISFDCYYSGAVGNKGLLQVDENGQVIWSSIYCTDAAISAVGFGLKHNLVKTSGGELQLMTSNGNRVAFTPILSNGKAPSCLKQDNNVLAPGFPNTGQAANPSSYCWPRNPHNISAFWLPSTFQATNSNAFDGTTTFLCGMLALADTMICEEEYKPIYANRCKEILEIQAKASAKEAYATYIDSVRSAFQARYVSHCLKAVKETFNMKFEHKEYHFTLYYYDQAGNLIQTVPPQGVAVILDTNIINSIDQARIDDVNFVYPEHTFKTQYEFNTLNQLTAQTTPDAGKSQFWYDRLGRMAVSQNAKQSSNANYSYTEYDELGRIKEVGQLAVMGLTASSNPEIIDDAGIMIDSAGVITKTSAHGWGNGGGISKLQFSGNCFVEHTVHNNESLSAAVGMSYTNPDNGYTSIQYKWYVHNSYYVNSANGYHGSGPVTGDVLRVERRNDTIFFKLNGVVKNFIKESISGQNLFLDFSIYLKDRKIKDLKVGTKPIIDFDLVFNPASLSDLLATADKEQITETYYDESYFAIIKDNFTQQNLRNRVVSTTYRDHDTLPYQSAVHYSYDIHGNVYSLVREIPELAGINQQYKQTDYNYDLVSGNVKAVHYQRGENDQFSHRYFYDLDNRLTNVETSENEVYWDQEVKYFYYKHGPLSRAEIGNLKVQGMDYAYTLHGWLKGVNSTSLSTQRDIGQDGKTGTVNQYVCKDEFGYSLGYYQGDYKNIGSLTQQNLFYAKEEGSKLAASTHSLYNGNISTMITAIGQFMNGKEPLGKAYAYDQLNRIVGASYFDNYDSTNNEWMNTGAEMQAYKSAYTYDANGNIMTLDRNGIAGNTAMDQMSYHYIEGTNKLSYVTDAVAASNYDSDIDNERAFNYLYDEIGNLVHDESEQIEKIDWTVYGKIKSITRDKGITPTYVDMVRTELDSATGEITKGPLTYVFNKWAKSGEKIAGDGFIEYTLPSSVSENYAWRFGISYLNNTSSYPDYSLYTNTGNQIYAYNLTTNVGGARLDGVGAGSVIRVERINDSIFFKVNGAIYHRRKESNVGDTLQLHIQLYASGTRVYVDDIVLNNGTSQTPTIAEKYLVIHDLSTNVLKIGPHDGWYAGGASKEKIGGNGSVKFALGAAEHNKGMVVGLSYTNPNYMYNTVDYGWYTNDGVTLKIYESGVLKTVTHGALNMGDVLQVERHGTNILYKLNGEVKRTVAEASPGDSLMIDFAMYDKDCILAGLRLYGTGLMQAGGSKPDMQFAYTPDGHRNMKRVIWNDSTKTTWYVRDASGNILSTYTSEEKDSSLAYTQNGLNIYGSSRVGVFNKEKTLVVVSGTDTTYTTEETTYYAYTRGRKHYELSNHLGNVQVVLTDKRLPVCDETFGTTLGYQAEVMSAYDYYPFGSPIKDRTYEFESYKFGFNGKEKDDEVQGGGNTYDYGFRIYNSRLGKFLSVDPLSISFPWNSSYAFAENDIIRCIDLEGLEKYIINVYNDSDGKVTFDVLLSSETISQQQTADGPQASFDGGKTYSTNFKYKELQKYYRNTQFGNSDTHGDGLIYVDPETGKRHLIVPNGGRANSQDNPSKTDAPSYYSGVLQWDNTAVNTTIIHVPNPTISINTDAENHLFDEGPANTTTNNYNTGASSTPATVSVDYDLMDEQNVIEILDGSGNVLQSFTGSGTGTITTTLPENTPFSVRVTPSTAGSTSDGWDYTVNIDTTTAVETPVDD